MNPYLSALVLGLCFLPLAMGTFLSLRVFNLPDITTDGAFTLGAAGSVLGLLAGWPPVLTLLVAMLLGTVAGSITGMLVARLRLNALLSGLLVMTALYSVNLGIMGKPNIPLVGQAEGYFPSGHTLMHGLLLALAPAALITFGLWSLLRTDAGLALRASGSNPGMAEAVGIDTKKMQVRGLALANGLTALSGALAAQLQGFADINMGMGMVMVGLASVMMGEAFASLRNAQPLGLRLAAIAGGTLLFRLLLAVALAAGIEPIYLRLLTSVLVLAFVLVPSLQKRAV